MNYNNGFTVLLFSTVSDIRDSLKNKSIHLEPERIVEVVAVKIKNGQIEKHFSSFVAIEDYDAPRFEFSEYNFNRNKLRSEHLIGAPSLKEVAKSVKAFVGDDTVILRGNGDEQHHPYCIFIEAAKKCGIIFDNEIADIGLIYDAVHLRDMLEDEELKFEEATPLEIAQTLASAHDAWEEIFLFNNVDFTPSDDAWEQDRDDPLSWALAFAKLLIYLLDLSPEWEVYEDDGEDIPF